VGGLHIRGTSTHSCASDADGKGPRIRISGCEKAETGNVDVSEKIKLSQDMRPSRPASIPSYFPASVPWVGEVH
jgi:hypothetical protein